MENDFHLRVLRGASLPRKRPRLEVSKLEMRGREKIRDKHRIDILQY